MNKINITLVYWEKPVKIYLFFGDRLVSELRSARYIKELNTTNVG